MFGNIVLTLMAVVALGFVGWGLWNLRKAQRAVDARMAKQRLDDEARRARLFEASRELRSEPVQPYQVTAYSHETAPRMAKPKLRPAAPKPAPKKSRSSSDSGYADYTYSGTSFEEYSNFSSPSSGSSDSGSSSSYSSYDSGSSSSSSDSGSSGGGSCD